MSSIYSTVIKVLEIGILSLDDELRLKVLLKSEYTYQDSDALAVLKHAIVFGHVKRQMGSIRKTSFTQHVKLSDN